MSKVAIIGTGTWGTALAQVLVDNNNDVLMYSLNQNQINDINNNHKNSFFFGDDIVLDSRIKATPNLEEALECADIVLISVPTAAIRSVISNINVALDHPVLFINTSKGFDTEKDQRISCLFNDVLDSKKTLGLVSLIGPSHAEEVIVRDLTCICAVSDNKEAANNVAQLFSNNYFRVYTNNDVVGSEIGVAMKNAIAIASGILEGLGYGDNARAALCTRGLAEIVRFGVSCGGQIETYLGLTGLGDLIVTCYSFHSRNFNAGMEIGKDNSVDNFLKNNTKTVEGIRTIEVIHRLAVDKNIELPIINALFNIVYKHKTPSDEINNLMSRPIKGE